MFNYLHIWGGTVRTLDVLSWKFLHSKKLIMNKFAMFQDISGNLINVIYSCDIWRKN